MAFTGTVCEYPYTAPDFNVTTVADCTVLYGEALGGGLAAFQAINLIAAILGAIVIGLRIVSLRTYCLAKKMSFWEHTHTVHFLLTFVFCIFWALEFIDYYGCWGILPIELYVIFDDIASACGVSHGVFFALFIYRIAKMVTKMDIGLVSILTKSIVALVWLIIVGNSILEVSVPTLFTVFESIKMFGVSATMAFFFVVSSMFALRIRAILLQGFELMAPDKQEQMQDGVNKLKKKQICLLGFATFIAVVCLANGVDMATREDMRHVVAVQGTLSASHIAFRVIYLLNVVIMLYVFVLPADADDLCGCKWARTKRRFDTSHTPQIGSGIKSDQSSHHNHSNNSNPRESNNDKNNSVAPAPDVTLEMSVN